MRSSEKKSAAYPRSTMSSEVSFASESIAFRFLGRSSIECRLGSGEPEDDKGQDKRDGAQEIRGSRHERDPEIVRVKPVAIGRHGAVVAHEVRPGRRQQSG